MMTARSPLQIAPGQRSDVLIQGPSLEPGETRRVYHLKQVPAANPLAAHGRSTDPNYVARLVVEGPPQSMSLPDLTKDDVRDKLARCRPFPPIQDAELSTPSIPSAGCSSSSRKTRSVRIRSTARLSTRCSRRSGPDRHQPGMDADRSDRQPSVPHPRQPVPGRLLHRPHRAHRSDERLGATPSTFPREGVTPSGADSASSSVIRSSTVTSWITKTRG